MTGQWFSLHQASIVSVGLDVFFVYPFDNIAAPLPCVPTHRPDSCAGNVLAMLQWILDRLGRMELPGNDQFEAFLRLVARRNRRLRTL
jgi:hypothetical protein